MYAHGIRWELNFHRGEGSAVTEIKHWSEKQKKANSMSSVNCKQLSWVECGNVDIHCLRSLKRWTRVHGSYITYWLALSYINFQRHCWLLKYLHFQFRNVILILMEIKYGIGNIITTKGKVHWLLLNYVFV